MYLNKYKNLHKSNQNFIENSGLLIPFPFEILKSFNLITHLLLDCFKRLWLSIYISLSLAKTQFWLEIENSYPTCVRPDLYISEKAGRHNIYYIEIALYKPPTSTLTMSRILPINPRPRLHTPRPPRHNNFVRPNWEEILFSVNDARKLHCICV